MPFDHFSLDMDLTEVFPSSVDNGTRRLEDPVAAADEGFWSWPEYESRPEQQVLMLGL